MHCALILVTLAILHHLHQYVMQVALWYYLSTNVTLVLIALILVALTQSHGIMCFCAWCFSVGCYYCHWSWWLGALMRCRPTFGRVLQCNVLLCFCASALLLVVLEHTWCNWCLVQLVHDSPV